MAAVGRRSSIGLQITCILAGRRINRDASSYTRNHCIQRQVDSAEEASSRSLPIDHRIFREIQPPCQPLYTCTSACPSIHIGTISTFFFHCSVLVLYGFLRSCGPMEKTNQVSTKLCAFYRVIYGASTSRDEIR